MDLLCPQCQSGRFFLETAEGTAFFALSAAGAPRDIVPEGRTVHLDPEVRLFCSGCAWNGTLAKLVEGS
jgi:hypothetical protein